MIRLEADHARALRLSLSAVILDRRRGLLPQWRSDGGEGGVPGEAVVE